MTNIAVGFWPTSTELNWTELNWYSSKFLKKYIIDDIAFIHVMYCQDFTTPVLRSKCETVSYTFNWSHISINKFCSAIAQMFIMDNNAVFLCCHGHTSSIAKFRSKNILLQFWFIWHISVLLKWGLHTNSLSVIRQCSYIFMAIQSTLSNSQPYNPQTPIIRTIF